jgi:predicted transcriptional regulator of viral defense system
MHKGDFLTSILRSNKTVFSSKDIALLWHEPGTPASRVRLSYYMKKGALYHIRKGLYAKDRSYNRLELATRIFTPSYVSFETVLARDGLIFQYYEKIYIASYLSRDITVDEQTYSFRKIKKGVLVHPIGVDHIDETSIATKERAFLDTLYINGDYAFDNLRSIDWDAVFDILPIYRNQRLEKVVLRIQKNPDGASL